MKLLKNDKFNVKVMLELYESFRRKPGWRFTAGVESEYCSVRLLWAFSVLSLCLGVGKRRPLDLFLSNPRRDVFGTLFEAPSKKLAQTFPGKLCEFISGGEPSTRFPPERLEQRKHLLSIFNQFSINFQSTFIIFLYLYTHTCKCASRVGAKHFPN